MSFDKADGIPLVNIHKPATKVNLWLVVGVVTFLLFGALAVISLA